MFDTEKRAFVAVAGEKELCLLPRMANRHGLITGATGTGKTVSLQTLAETFSSMGVPVFAADIKGDLSGVAAKGGGKESVNKRVASMGLESKGFSFQGFPVEFWDVFGEQGTPVRATIADMGPLLLSRLLLLNDTQSAVLTLVFKIAKDSSFELVDLKDLQKCLEYAAANAGTFTASYGNISAASIGAIQRGLVTLEQEGGDLFFGEPALNIDDLLQTRGSKGVINILAADRLMRAPGIYSTLLLWLLSRLFEVLPEVGDREKPVLVFFFDEAHLLFDEAPKALLDKIEQVVRLIRSKGVGVYFITQSPADVPDSVLGQLGNRVQHALRAYTPKDQKALKAAAQSFRANPAFDTEKAIAELGIGEALVSFLDEKGAPQPVERSFILPPEGQIGPLSAGERAAMLQASPVYQHYRQVVDRTTAFEKLSQQPESTMSAKERAARAKVEEKARKEEEKIRKEEEKARLAAEKQQQRQAAEEKRFWGRVATTVLAPVARQLIGAIFRRK